MTSSDTETDFKLIIIIIIIIVVAGSCGECVQDGSGRGGQLRPPQSVLNAEPVLPGQRRPGPPVLPPTLPQPLPLPGGQRLPLSLREKSAHQRRVDDRIKG